MFLIPGRVQTVGLECTYNGAVVVTSLGQLNEVLTASGRVFDIQFDLKVSHGGFDRHPRGVPHHLDHDVAVDVLLPACSGLDQHSTGSPSHAGCLLALFYTYHTQNVPQHMSCESGAPSSL